MSERRTHRVKFIAKGNRDLTLSEFRRGLDRAVAVGKFSEDALVTGPNGERLGVVISEADADA